MGWIGRPTSRVLGLIILSPKDKIDVIGCLLYATRVSKPSHRWHRAASLLHTTQLAQGYHHNSEFLSQHLEVSRYLIHRLDVVALPLYIHQLDVVEHNDLYLVHIHQRSDARAYLIDVVARTHVDVDR